MATGIPGKTKYKNFTNSSQLSFRLEYEGKVSLEEILDSPSAKLSCVVRVDKPINNKLIYGENFRVLRNLSEHSDVAGKIGLIYIDPPYATGLGFESRQQAYAYQDFREGVDYLEFIRQRLVLLRELLANHGSIYVHLDQNMAFPVKILMDEIFGSKNFRNWITRKKCNPKNYTRNQYGNISDYILFYTKTDDYVWNQPFESWTDDKVIKEYQYIEEETGRRYKKVPIHAPGERKGATGQPWRGMLPPPGKHWQYTPETLEEMDKRGEIYWSSTGNPRRKVYLDQSKGIGVQDIWLDFKDAHNQNIKITGYPTEKNPELLQRIIMASSNPGDLILDAFVGSGTTVAVAEELQRQWIGIDNSLLAIETTIYRLVKGTQAMGDFTKRNGSLPKQEPLINTNRILKSGLEVYLEMESELDQVAESQIEDWNNLLNFQANLW
ncbi:Modification methylase EcaI [Planktothrix tepida]|uniref:Modification methylase EcaI n=2 Tax=Planktothrix TaxID=54304 RepID=A0A1J1LG28_9CYAN|nr:MULTISPECIES: site-specific DNA-methyltransferase [Planktothrix]CAD5930150.1 Modification methylase EcaI [Planktothrix tepida]CAD5979617.1 Modification methylase EcaI [Planktothrix pseudagardhii]CUR31527.1 Modification methylase EcaI [Planktothrix tepida PCC 9214]